MTSGFISAYLGLSISRSIDSRGGEAMSLIVRWHSTLHVSLIEQFYAQDRTHQRPATEVPEAITEK
jgi:hypothetical protein